jgi:hypothetical protein
MALSSLFVLSNALLLKDWKPCAQCYVKTIWPF